jgi:hypothetical protein
MIDQTIDPVQRIIRVFERCSACGAGNIYFPVAQIGTIISAALELKSDIARQEARIEDLKRQVSK